MLATYKVFWPLGLHAGNLQCLLGVAGPLLGQPTGLLGVALTAFDSVCWQPTSSFGGCWTAFGGNLQLMGVA